MTARSLVLLATWARADDYRAYLEMLNFEYEPQALC